MQLEWQNWNSNDAQNELLWALFARFSIKLEQHFSVTKYELFFQEEQNESRTALVLMEIQFVSEREIQLTLHSQPSAWWWTDLTAKGITKCLQPFCTKRINRTTEAVTRCRCHALFWEKSVRRAKVKGPSLYKSIVRSSYQFREIKPTSVMDLEAESISLRLLVEPFCSSTVCHRCCGDTKHPRPYLLWAIFGSCQFDFTLFSMIAKASHVVRAMEASLSCPFESTEPYLELGLDRRSKKVFASFRNFSPSFANFWFFIDFLSEFFPRMCSAFSCEARRQGKSL